MPFSILDTRRRRAQRIYAALEWAKRSLDSINDASRGNASHATRSLLVHWLDDEVFTKPPGNISPEIRNEWSELKENFETLFWSITELDGPGSNRRPQLPFGPPGGWKSSLR